MTRPKIIVHCLVRNEECFIWYALKSVLPFVDKVMVWDTGSTDSTVKIIKSINSNKISFKEVGTVDPISFTKVSQQMIKETPKEYTWIFVLDGDEVWPQDSIKKVIKYAKDNPETESIAVHSHNLVGDIYHRLPESAGGYELAGQKGHLAIRLMNRKTIPGLHFDLPHGQRGLFDKDNRLIQDRDPKKISLLDVYYHHSTHLPRSSKDFNTIKRKQKLKYELGKKISNKDIPKIFFANKPAFVPDVSKPMSITFFLISLIQTPLRRIKRILFPAKSGY